MHIYIYIHIVRIILSFQAWLSPLVPRLRAIAKLIIISSSSSTVYTTISFYYLLLAVVVVLFTGPAAGAASETLRWRPEDGGVTMVLMYCEQKAVCR